MIILMSSHLIAALGGSSTDSVFMSELAIVLLIAIGVALVNIYKRMKKWHDEEKLIHDELLELALMVRARKNAGTGENGMTNNQV